MSKLKILPLFNRAAFLAVSIGFAGIFLIAVAYFFVVVLDDLKMPCLAEAEEAQFQIEKFKTTHGVYPISIDQLCLEKDQVGQRCPEFFAPFFYRKTIAGYELYRLGSNWYFGAHNKPMRHTSQQSIGN